MSEEYNELEFRITLRCGNRLTPLSIADALIGYIMDSTRPSDRKWDNIRIIGEALLSMYQGYEKSKELQE